MSKNSLGLVFLWLVIGISIICILPWSIRNPGDLRSSTEKSCNEKGGKYNHFKGGWICVKDGLIIDMNK